jgi:hypothetical protein
MRNFNVGALYVQRLYYRFTNALKPNKCTWLCAPVKVVNIKYSVPAFLLSSINSLSIMDIFTGTGKASNGDRFEVFSTPVAWDLL